LLQRSGYALPNLNDVRCRSGGKVFEVGVVLARDHLDMARTDRVRVEECDYELILVDHLRCKLAGGDAAEHTRGRNHLGNTSPGSLSGETLTRSITRANVTKAAG
jgi:hypothetical protein